MQPATWPYHCLPGATRSQHWVYPFPQERAMGKNLKDFFFTFHICISQWNMSDKNYIQEGTEPKGLTTYLTQSTARAGD